MELESAFEKFMVEHLGAVDLDKIPEYKFLKRKGDYYLDEMRSIFEVKSISSDRSEALKPWLQKRVESSSEVKNGMPVLFGTASFKELYKEHSNKALFEKQLDTFAARTLENYIRDSKEQIFDTKKSLDCKDAFGFLVILNESFQFYETWFVYRIIQAMLQKIKTETPHLIIDGVLYINESNKAMREFDMVFIHEPKELDHISPNETLEKFAREWAKYQEYV
jgi:hypothetical protein